MPAVRVSHVARGSVAASLGIEPGTELLSVNGRRVEDFLDWEFLTADDELIIEARQPGGEPVVYEIERPEGEPIGVELEPPTIRRCANRCEFCFIEGLPAGPASAALPARRRLSAVVRVRQLRDAVEREGPRHQAHPRVPAVAALRLRARDALVEARKRAAEQSEACPTSSRSSRRWPPAASSSTARWSSCRASTTDEVLEQSLTDLWALGDAVLSVAVVPVGLTQFSHLYTGQSMDSRPRDALLDGGRPVGGSRRDRARPSVGVRIRRVVSARRARAPGTGALRRLCRRSRTASGR